MFKTWHKSTEMVVLLYQLRVSSWFAWIVFSYVKRRSTNCDRQDWPGILRSNRQQAPIHYICADYIQPTTSAQNISLHFSVVLQFFLLSDIFPNISPHPSIAHVWNPNPCQFFPLDFFPKQRLTQELVKYGSLSNGAMDQEGWLRFSTSFFTKLPRQSHWDVNILIQC